VRDVAHLRQATAGRAAALGTSGPLELLHRSHRLALHALSLARCGDGRGELPDAFIECEGHLLTLMRAWEPGLADRHAEHALAPLDGVPDHQRRTLEVTLLAWLREQGRVIPTAQALPVHPQTVRYRLRQLRELFGERLDDSDTRHELESALRWRYRRCPQGGPGGVPKQGGSPT